MQLTRLNWCHTNFYPFFQIGMLSALVLYCMRCGRGSASTRRVIMWVVQAPAQAGTRFRGTVSCRNKQFICGSAVGLDL
jgi:hypothetical protein